ncbi:hypothetical protein [Streptomyces sp. NPDC002426]
MSETTVALLVAIIGAGAAIYAGIMARETTSQQTERTVNAQRDQALWELRRDTYTRYIFATKECARINGINRAGEKSQEINAAIEELQKLYVQMELATPKGETILLVAKSIIEHFKELSSLEIEYDKEIDSSYAEILRIELRDGNRDLNLSIAMLQEAVQAELNRNTQ